MIDVGYQPKNWRRSTESKQGTFACLALAILCYPKPSRYEERVIIKYFIVKDLPGLVTNIIHLDVRGSKASRYLVPCHLLRRKMITIQKFKA